MKKYTFIALVAAATVSLSSCYDLDRFPDNQLSSGTTFKSEDGCKTGMMGVYALMRGDNVLGKYFFNDAQGGRMYVYDQFENEQKGTYTPKTGDVTNRWKNLYEGVARANNVIQQITANADALTASGMDAAKQAQYVAEAKFLRGMYYYYLLEFFADPVQGLGVPYYDESIVVATNYLDMMNPRETLDKCIANVVADMQEAADKLPAEWDKSNSGRATKGSAYGYMGKAYLLKKDYTNALSAFQKIEALGVHDLYRGVWSDMFQPDAADACSEMIFSIQSLGGTGYDLGLPLNFMLGTRTSYGGCWNNGMITNNAIEKFDYIDGTPFDWKAIIPGYINDDEALEAYKAAGGKVTSDAYQKAIAVRANAWWCTVNSKAAGMSASRTKEDVEKRVKTWGNKKAEILAMYEKRDPRMAMTAILPFTWYTGYTNSANDLALCIVSQGSDKKSDLHLDGNQNGFVSWNNAQLFYLFRKFVCVGDANGKITNRAYTPINFPLIRLADVYLLEAECYAKAGQFDKCAEYINKVRSRVGVADRPVPASWDEALEMLDKERTCELLGEGHAYVDMRRWGKLETLNGKRDFSISGAFTRYARVAEAKDYAWPIPTDEISMNKSIIQNTGWKTADNED
ncbi:MAG: RagB/SusD family nutrient uptake outer membrane protein [Bacteroidales bacterium]|nr:RagB/SusD family nutrient uptake outer membrane protein [Bacteroidales bacterium]